MTSGDLPFRITGERYPSRRSVVMSTRGMVGASQPLAAQAGLRMLLAGGNAADAAVATAAALNIVEPMSTGIGDEAFALVYDAASRRVRTLNGSGQIIVVDEDGVRHAGSDPRKDGCVVGY